MIPPPRRGRNGVVARGDTRRWIIRLVHGILTAVAQRDAIGGVVSPAGDVLLAFESGDVIGLENGDALGAEV